VSEVCHRLHSLFNSLPRHRFPFDELAIHRNGIYILFEKGEYAHGADRIVRVGTHTGENQLRSRLKQHFVNENKDRSIFRKNIGRAILQEVDDPFLEQWKWDLTTRQAKEQYSPLLDKEKQRWLEQAVRSAIAKNTRVPGKTQEELDTAIRQIVSKAIASDEIIDIFSAAGLKKPDISILSDEFLSEVQKMPHRNLALELLHKLLSDEIKSRARKNLVQSRSFAEMLEKTIRRYQNKTIEATQVILELIELAKQMREARSRGEKLGLSEDEEAFYDALEVNDSAVKVLGDEVLKKLARELVETVRRNTTIDWTVRESARAKLRTMVRRLLRKYGYPPDKQEKATLTVLEQAELLGRDWAN